VIVFAEVGRQIECVQAVSVCVFVASDKQTFVSSQFACYRKDGVVRPYILSRCNVWLDGFQGVFLLAVQVKSDFVLIKMSKLERISVSAAVKCPAVDQSDYNACR